MRAAIFVAVIVALSACNADKPAPSARSTPSAQPAVLSPSASASSASQEPTPVLSEFCFNGTIGDRSVSGALKAFGDRVNGEYYEAKAGSSSKRKLTGTRSGSTVTLKEQASKGEATGTFEGSVNGAGHYTGTWSGASGPKKLPFDLGPTMCGPEYW